MVYKMGRRDLNKVSVANQYFERALKAKDSKLKEGDRQGYVKAWDRAGQIIKRARGTAARKPARRPEVTDDTGTQDESAQGQAGEKDFANYMDKLGAITARDAVGTEAEPLII